MCCARPWYHAAVLAKVYASLCQCIDHGGNDRGLGTATALGSLRGTRVVARRPVRIGLIRSLVGVKYAKARHSTVTIRGTTIISFRLSSHPCVPVVQGLKRHGLCRCCDRQGEHYNEKPHYCSSVKNAKGERLQPSPLHLAKNRQERFQCPTQNIHSPTVCCWSFLIIMTGSDVSEHAD